MDAETMRRRAAHCRKELDAARLTIGAICGHDVADDAIAILRAVAAGIVTGSHAPADGHTRTLVLSPDGVGVG